MKTRKKITESEGKLISEIKDMKSRLAIEQSKNVKLCEALNDRAHDLDRLHDILEKKSEEQKEFARNFTELQEKSVKAEQEVLRLTERLGKIAASSFGIAKAADGTIKLINAPEFNHFLAVQRVERLSIYEAAMQIEDLEKRATATDAVAKANAERNEVQLAKIKDRLIVVLNEQARGK